jgi:hypothetical protein
LQLKEESTQAQWARQLLGHPSSCELKSGSQNDSSPLSPLRPRGCSFAIIRTARYQTDGSRGDCCLCSRVKRVFMQRGWEGFRTGTTPLGNFNRSKSPRSPPPDDSQVGDETFSRSLDSQHWSWTQRSAKHCAADLFQRRASVNDSFFPIEMTIPSWPRHACEVLSIKGGCVGGSPIDAFESDATHSVYLPGTCERSFEGL